METNSKVVYAIDFRLSHLDVFACEKGHVGFSIGPSELCFIAFHSLPLPKIFGSLSVLPPLPKVTSILNDKLCIFVFIPTKNGPKLVSTCDMILSPKHLNPEVNENDCRNVISKAEFQSNLHHSSGVGTLSGSVSGQISLLRLQPQKTNIPSPIKPAFLDKVLVDFPKPLSNTCSIQEDFLQDETSTDSTETVKASVSSPPKAKAEEVSPTIDPEDNHCDVVKRCSPELTHYVEVDNSNHSQVCVQVSDAKKGGHPRSDELHKRALIPWCLSFHVDDSHSVRIRSPEKFKEEEWYDPHSGLCRSSFSELEFSPKRLSNPRAASRYSSHSEASSKRTKAKKNHKFWPHKTKISSSEGAELRSYNAFHSQPLFKIAQSEPKETLGKIAGKEEIVPGQENFDNKQEKVSAGERNISPQNRRNPAVILHEDDCLPGMNLPKFLPVEAQDATLITFVHSEDNKEDSIKEINTLTKADTFEKDNIEQYSDGFEICNREHVVGFEKSLPGQDDVLFYTK